MRRIALIGLLVAGCAPSAAYFRPTEKALGESFEGQEQAIYDLSGPSGRAGEVKVWTNGAYREHQTTVLRVHLDVESTTESVVELDGRDLKLASVVGEHGTLRDVGPSEVSPGVRVEPGDLAGVSALFTLPGDIDPEDIDGFVLRWTARVDGRPTTELTPFVRLQHSYAPYVYSPFYWPYYDPFYSPFYFGLRVYTAPFWWGGWSTHHHHGPPAHPAPAPRPGPAPSPPPPDVRQPQR